MHNTNLGIVLSVFVGIISGLVLVNVFDYPQTAQATGGAGEIKGLIDPIIDRAIIALESNNTELALEEIQTLKNELDDTFATDEKEDD